jgi:DNA-binding transcriptional MerR regulator
VKTLRNYHRLGLLDPADVDPATGYRRYSSDQIPTAQIIRRFRDLDMPLEEIAAVLNAPDVGTRNSLLSDHLARLESELAQTQAAVASLRSLLDGPPPALALTHRREPPIEAAAIAAVVDLEDLSPWFQGALGELQATVDAQNRRANGPPGALITDEFFSEERGEVTVFLPTSRPVRSVGRVSPTRLPATELATIVHHGSHDEIDRAYGALAAYVSQQALAVNGPVRERYLVGRLDTSDQTRWRTEIGWPIFDTAHNPESEAGHQRSSQPATTPKR